MAFENFDWRSTLWNFDRLNDGLESFSKGINDRALTEQTGAALMKAYDDLNRGNRGNALARVSVPDPVDVNQGPAAPVAPVEYGVPNGAKNALFDMGALSPSSGPNALAAYNPEPLTPSKTGWNPRNLIYHDYGGNPENKDGVFNPYHALVYPDGTIRYRNPQDPYGQKAPHAYRMNSDAIGLAYAGPVGSTPTPQAMEALRRENAKLQQLFPGIKGQGHGEAYAATRGTSRQASRDGRDLIEASWRSNLGNAPQTEPTAPPPVSQRGIAQVAGSQPVRVADSSGGISRDAFQALAGQKGTQDTAQRLYLDKFQRANPTREENLNYDAKRQEFYKAQAELYSGRAKAVLMMPETDPRRSAVWSQVLDAYRKEHPEDEIDADEADPITGPQIMMAKAGEFLDQRKLDLDRRKTEAEIKKLEAQAKNGGGDIPSNVQEWEYFQKLSPEQKQQFIALKRAQKVLDLGDSYGISNQLNPGEVSGKVQKNLAEAERQKAIGEAQGKQIAAAPGDIQSANQALALIESIRNDKNIEQGTGFSSYGNVIRGTSGYDFQNKVNQARSGAFLTAIQQLRGMGALSNAEGQTATDAVTRMDTATSKEAFLSALKDYELLVKQGLAKAQGRLGQEGAAALPPEPNAIAPGTEMDGYIYKGGNPADPQSWVKK